MALVVMATAYVDSTLLVEQSGTVRLIPCRNHHVARGELFGCRQTISQASGMHQLEFDAVFMPFCTTIK
jgi:hypothetical protein